MAEMLEPASIKPFDQRRSSSTKAGKSPTGSERRQFADSRDGLSPDAQELALAIDRYKIMHRRRYITQEELLSIIRELGYHK